MRPIILIHGYSDSDTAFSHWSEYLASCGYDVASIHACNYKTLTNEVTIKDIAEAFDRALKYEAMLSEDDTFDVIVHSTGILVIRAWLSAYAKRRGRVRHLIALAPATFGSPLAHKGRSWLGAIFKGNKELGADFLEAGNEVLDALELGSRFTWDLAHQDILGEECFSLEPDTPYVFVMCGASPYDGLRRPINKPGTDGTVRFAGCALNCRKILLDLTSEGLDGTERVTIGPWCNQEIPLIAVENLNHGTILSDPNGMIKDLVSTALKVEDEQQFRSWVDHAKKATGGLVSPWQQFVMRVLDERGDPVTDYHVELIGNLGTQIAAFDLDVHVYSRDRSLRCFHVNHEEIIRGNLRELKLRIIASSGSSLVGYRGYSGGEKDNLSRAEDKWNAIMDITELLDSEHFRFFHPLTTTLIEVKVNREPLPAFGRNGILQFSQG